MKYKIESIQNSKVYMKESKSSYLPELYYLVSQKDYLDKKNLEAYSTYLTVFNTDQYFLQR